jgi:hypothetical protein
MRVRVDQSGKNHPPNPFDDKTMMTGKNFCGRANVRDDAGRIDNHCAIHDRVGIAGNEGIGMQRAHLLP